MTEAREPQIVEFGPYRVIGMSYVGKNAQGEIPAMWGQFGPRMGELHEGPCQGAFGLCRCAPGAGEGAFEYLAAAPVEAGTAVPEGMVEAAIPASTYVVFQVPNLEAIHQAWEACGAWMQSHPEWEGYCQPTAEGCDCIANPSFEYYPPNWNPQAELFIYMPVRPAAK